MNDGGKGGSITQNTATSLSCAFTLLDLLFAVALLSSVALITASASVRNHTRSAATICMSNMRQLTVAWLNYADDNNSKLVQNFHGGEAQGGAAATSGGGRNAPWACGWLDWTTSSDNTNHLFLRDARYAKLGPYISVTNNIHKCPSDNYLSAVQQAKNWKERVRTMSMNITMGDGNAPAGPWDPLYRQAKTFGDLRLPSPSESTVFIEEHPDSINDPALFPPHDNAWVDVPATFHEEACGFSFADGHIEMHGWKGSLMHNPVRTSYVAVPVAPGDPDTAWMSYHSQRSR